MGTYIHGQETAPPFAISRFGRQTDGLQAGQLKFDAAEFCSLNKTILLSQCYMSLLSHAQQQQATKFYDIAHSLKTATRDTSLVGENYR